MSKGEKNLLPCYNPEKYNEYPLCVGEGSEKCQECSMYKGLDFNKYE